MSFVFPCFSILGSTPVSCASALSLADAIDLFVLGYTELGNDLHGRTLALVFLSSLFSVLALSRPELAAGPSSSRPWLAGREVGRRTDGVGEREEEKDIRKGAWGFSLSARGVWLGLGRKLSEGTDQLDGAYQLRPEHGSFISAEADTKIQELGT